MPIACLNARPNSPLIVRQNWIAASENNDGRPRLPQAKPDHCRSRSSQIITAPRAFRPGCSVSSWSSCTLAGSGLTLSLIPEAYCGPLAALLGILNIATEPP